MARDAWTDDMGAVLHEVAGEGGSYNDAAQRLGVSRCAVAGRAKRVGIIFQGAIGGAKAKKFSAHEIAYLLENCDKVSNGSLAAHLGRSPGSVSKKVSDLRRNGLVKTDLTEAQESILEAMSRSVWKTPVEIAAETNSTTDAVTIARELAQLKSRGLVEMEKDWVSRRDPSRGRVNVWRLAPQAQEIAA